MNSRGRGVEKTKINDSSRVFRQGYIKDCRENRDFLECAQKCGFAQKLEFISA